MLCCELFLYEMMNVVLVNCYSFVKITNQV